MTSGKRRLLSPEALDEATEQIAAIAKKEGARVALVGGLALQHYGSPRLTGDVDVVAEELLDGLRKGRQLSFGGEATKAPNGVPVDVIVRADGYAALYQEALNRAYPVRSQLTIYTPRGRGGVCRSLAKLVLNPSRDPEPRGPRSAQPLRRSEPWGSPQLSTLRRRATCSG